MPKQNKLQRLLMVRNRLHKIAKPMIVIGLFLFISFSFFASSSLPALAAASSTINFQARLEQANGAIVPDGSYNVEFKLYNSATSTGSSQGSCSGDTSCLWTEDWLNSASQGISVHDGYLTASLGSITAFPSTINWNQQLYLTMNIGGTGTTATWNGEMNPRLLLTAVPYAFQSGQLAQYNATTGFNSTLSIVQPTGGNQTFQVPDQAAAGSYSLCIQGAANSTGGCAPTTGGSGYIQNTTTQQTSANFNIAGSGVIGTTLNVTGATTLSSTLAISGTTTVLAKLGVGTTTPTSQLQVASSSATTVGQIIQGAASQTADLLDLNNSSGVILSGFNSSGDLYLASGSYNVTLSTATQANSIALTIPADTSTTDTICLQTLKNCSSSGVTTVGSLDGGTANANGAYISGTTIYLQSASTTYPGLVNNTTQSFSGNKTFTGNTTTSGTLTASSTSLFKDSTNSTTAFQVQNTSGADVLNVDTVNSRVGIGTATPAYPLDVVGNINTTGNYLINGTQISSSNLANSANIALLNATQTFTGANTFSGSTTTSGSLTATGTSLFKDSTNSTTAFEVQNAAGASLLTANTTIPQIAIGQGNLVITGLATPSGVAITAGSNSAGSLSGSSTTNYYYQVSALNAAGESLASTETSINGESFTPIAAPATPTLTTATTGGSLSGATYYYKVTALTANGQTIGSTEASIVVPTTTTTNTVTVSWTAVTGATSYNVYRGTTSGGENVYYNTTATSYTDTGATGTSGTVPTTNTATTNTNEVTVSWTAVTGATSYNVYRGTTSGGENVYYNTTATSYTDTGATGTSATPQASNQTSKVGIGTSTPSANLQVEGNTILQSPVNSTTAFQVQNASGSGSDVLSVDTTNNQLLLGNASSINGQLAFYNSTNAYTVTLVSGVTTASYSLTLPTAAPGTSQCLSSGSTTASALYWTSCGSGSGTGSGVTTVGSLDGGTANANGAYISGTTIYLQSASTTYPGLVNNTTQSFSGNKTFTGNLTTTGTGLLQVQNASGYDVISANTSSGQFLLGTATSLNGLVSFANSSNSNLIGLTVAAGSSAYNLTLPSSVPGTSQCLRSGASSATTLVWGPCSNTHAKVITLTPEYAGAVFSTGGFTNDIGTMTAGYDTTQNESYYQWTTGQSTNQEYDIVVRVPLPSNFSSWASSTPITADVKTSDTTNGTVSATLKDTTGTTETSWNSCPLTPTTANAWATLTGCSVSGTYTANGVMTLILTLQSPSNGATQLGDISLNYNSAY